MFSNFFESDFYAILKRLILTGIAIYSLVQLATEVNSLRSSLAFQTTPIEDRCIPLFRQAQDLYARDPAVQMLYDYRSGTVDLRVCSGSLSRAEVIDIVGRESADILSDALDGAPCSRSQVGFQSTLSANAPQPNATAVLALTPLPDAWTWQYAISTPDPQSTTCQYFFRYMGNPVCPANATAVVPFRKTNKYIEILTILALSISTTITVSQTIFFFCRLKEDTDKDNMLVQAYVDQGLVAGLHVLYLVLIKDQPIKESPDVPYIWPSGGFYYWFLFIDDALSIIASAVAIYGCSVNSFAKAFALIILKSLKLVYTLIMAIYTARKSASVSVA
eukprot:m.44276 g.44276  ORF g.44276 m.44276 type:complete len:333 (-) comp10892_c0_seq1:100-1098(-)